MMALDSRQRAMLEEMGVHVWAPMPTAEADAPVALSAPIAAPAAAASASVPGTAPATSPSVTRPPPTSARPPQAGQRAPEAAPAARPSADLWLEAAPQRLYPGDAAAQGGWLIVADVPPGADGRHTDPFAGDAGRLLDNMLRALQLERAGVAVHLLRVHRGAAGPSGVAQPLADGLAAQLDALNPRVVLALGALAAQQLFGTGEPLGKLRGRTGAMADRPGMALVASYPPAYLLRNQADKAKAWADLCLAASLVD